MIGIVTTTLVMAMTGCSELGPSDTGPIQIQQFRRDALDTLKRGVSYEPMPSVRTQAIESLETAAPREGVPWIRNALADEHPAVRFAACMALASLKDEASRKSFKRLLSDPNASVRVAAIAGLHALGDTTHSAELADYLMQTDDMPAKRNAVLALGRLGEKGAIPLLARHVESSDEALHAQALESLALLGHEDAMRQLAFEANSGVGPQQVFAVNALAQVRNEKYRGVYHHALENAVFTEVKLAAARALGGLGSKDGMDVAMSNIRFNRPDSRNLEKDPAENQIRRMRQLAALALGEIGEKQSLGVLREAMMDNEYPGVQVAAAKATLQIVRRHDRAALPFALGND